MRFLGSIVSHWGSCSLKQRNLLQNAINHSQLPNIFILLSIFGSLSHNFKVHRVDIWLYCCFSGVRGEFIFEKASSIEETTSRNREIHCIFFKTSNNYPTFLFYYHFLVHFLIISRSAYFFFLLLFLTGLSVPIPFA